MRFRLNISRRSPILRAVDRDISLSEDPEMPTTRARQPRPTGAAALLQLALLAPLLLPIACQPKDERPGAWLRGESFAKPVADWSFAADSEEIFVETRPWYGIRHSTTIWCVVLDNVLYVGSYGDEKKSWEKNVARNSAARLSIDGKLYEVNITPVTAKNLATALDAAYAAKYDMEEVFGAETPPWWYYRVTQGSG